MKILQKKNLGDYKYSLHYGKPNQAMKTENIKDKNIKNVKKFHYMAEIINNVNKWSTNLEKGIRKIDDRKDLINIEKLQENLEVKRWGKNQMDNKHEKT